MPTRKGGGNKPPQKPPTDMKKILAHNAKTEEHHAKESADLIVAEAKVEVATAVKKATISKVSLTRVQAELRSIAEGSGSDAKLIEIAMESLAEVSEVERKGALQLQKLADKQAKLEKQITKEDSKAKQEELLAIKNEVDRATASIDKQAEFILRAVERQAKSKAVKDKLAGSGIGKELAKENFLLKRSEQRSRREDFMQERKEIMRSIGNKLKLAEQIDDKDLISLLRQQQAAADDKEVARFDHFQRLIDSRLQDSDQETQRNFELAEKMAARRTFAQRKMDALAKGFHDGTVGKVKELMSEIGTENHNLLSWYENKRAGKEVALIETFLKEEKATAAERYKQQYGMDGEDGEDEDYGMPTSRLDDDDEDDDSEPATPRAEPLVPRTSVAEPSDWEWDDEDDEEEPATPKAEPSVPKTGVAEPSELVSEPEPTPVAEGSPEPKAEPSVPKTGVSNDPFADWVDAQTAAAERAKPKAEPSVPKTGVAEPSEWEWDDEEEPATPKAEPSVPKTGVDNPFVSLREESRKETDAKKPEVKLEPIGLKERETVAVSPPTITEKPVPVAKEKPVPVASEKAKLPVASLAPTKDKKTPAPEPFLKLKEVSTPKHAATTDTEPKPRTASVATQQTMVGGNPVSALEAMREDAETQDTNRELRGINKSLAKIAKSGLGGAGSGGSLLDAVRGLTGKTPVPVPTGGGKAGAPGGKAPVPVPGGKPTVPGAPGGGKVAKALQYGKTLGKGLFGLTVGLATDWALGKAQENQEEKGNKKTAASIDVTRSAVTGAGTGAMIGSVVPGVGTVVGAAVGGAVGTAYGLWDNKEKLLAKDSPVEKDKVKNQIDKSSVASGGAVAGGGAAAVASATSGSETTAKGGEATSKPKASAATIGAAVSSVQASGAVDYSPAGGDMTGKNLASKVSTGQNVDLKHLTGDTSSRLSSLASDYTAATGKKIQVNSAARSYEKQAQLYADYKSGKPGANPANKPGTSLHEVGMAVDAQPSQVDEMDKLGLLKKNGFERISGAKERQHIQLAGAQKAISSGSSGMVSGDAVGVSAEKVTAGSTSSTVSASAPAMASSVSNDQISVAANDVSSNLGGSQGGASSQQSAAPAQSYGSAGGRSGRRSGNAITVSNTPTFMFTDPAFYATNVQAMA